MGLAVKKYHSEVYSVRFGGALRAKFGKRETADYANNADKGNDENRRTPLSADEF